MFRNRCRNWAAVAGAGCLGLLINLLAYSPPIWGAPPHKPADSGKPTSQPASPEDQLRQQQSAAWTAFYAAKYEDAIKLADPLLKAPKEWARVEAWHMQARAFMAAGTKASEAKAQQLWNAIEKVSTLNAHKERMSIAKALALDAKGQSAAAIELLDKTVSRKFSDTCTAEAAIELARLQVKAKDFDKAKETLEFAVAFLQNGAKGELSSIAIEPFITAAKAAIARLPYDQDPGREAFEKADALREAKKYVEAAKAYQAVAKGFPKTDYAPRSEMSIGYCLVGLKQPDQAVEHWKKFITPAPAGSWRGQALVAIIDVELEEVLDLTEANKWAEVAGASIEAGLSSTAAPGCVSPAESWKKCVLDIHLRRGLVAFLMEKNKTAVEAFEQAKTAAREPRTEVSGPAVDSTGIVKGLDRLIAAAKANKPVTPDEVHDAKADKKVALLCAMGTIYNCTEQYKRAENTFSRVATVEFAAAKTKPKLPTATRPGEEADDAPPALVIKTSKGPLGQNASAAQFSYAIFGRGSALQGQDNLPQAKESFLADLKTFPEGSWRDETLFRVATAIENLAEIRCDKPKVTGKTPTSKPAHIGSSDDAAEKVRLANLAKAKSEAVPYWQELVAKFPKSSRCEDALYNIGIVQYELAEAGIDASGRALLPDRIEQAWKDVAAAIGKFCTAYPKSLLAGNAYIRYFDLALERLFDLEMASNQADAATKWANSPTEAVDSHPVEKQQAITASELWRTSPSKEEVNRKQVSSECFLRVGLVAYMDQKYELAKTDFEAAIKSMGSNNSGTESLPSLALRIVVMAVDSKQPITDFLALQEKMSDHQRVAIQVADLYLKAMRTEKAESLYRRILSDETMLGRPQIGLRGYATMKLAESLDRQPSRRKEALETLNVFRKSEFAGTYWGGYGLFRLAVTTFNQNQDKEESLKMYDEMIHRYPNHPKTELAYAYFCLNAFRAGHREEAETTFAAFKTKYPQSKWISIIAEESKKPGVSEQHSKNPIGKETT